MLVTTRIGSTIANTPLPISTQSHAIHASPSPEGRHHSVFPEQQPAASCVLVTRVARCLNFGLRFEFARQNTVGQAYAGQGGADVGTVVVTW
jgi:hypothetical protein